MIDVIHVAKLANLTLTPTEIETYTSQFISILKYFEQLKSVNINKVAPTYQVLDDTTNITREDIVTPSFSLKEALSQASKTFKGYFFVDNVFEKNNSSSNRTKIKSRKKLDHHNAILTQVDPQGTIGYKDLFCTQGIETTAGANLLSGFKPPYSATLVKRLEEAGFKTKYKLNQDAWGHGSSGENSDFGPTLNPYDHDKVPGGSSSGSGVVVATGKVDLATGTDTCGSVRMPACYCNISALKPTYGALSRYGVIAFGSSLDCPGLMANSVIKLKKYFNILAKPDPNDSTTQSPKRYSPPSTETKTIGLPKEFFDDGLDSRVKKTIFKAVAVFKKEGYKVKEISLPPSRYSLAVYYLIAFTETSSNLSRFDGVRFGHNRSHFSAEAKRRIMLGSFASSSGYSAKYYQKAAQVRTLIIEDMKKAFESVDVLLGPVSPLPVFKVGEKVNDPLKLYLMDIYATVSSLSGSPSLALPGGFINGMPIGFQLMGPRWSEQRLFKLGELFQAQTNHHLKRPNP